MKHLYVFENEAGFVKIGISKNPKSRLNTLQNQSGLKIVRSYISPICENAKDIESLLHKKFSVYRRKGEYFSCLYETVLATVQVQDYYNYKQEECQEHNWAISKR